MGNVIAVCTSPAKGTQKTNVGTAQFQEDWGIVGDAHAGKWRDGDFGENLVVSGIDFRALPIGTKFRCNDVVLELTQIGKECHHGCQIFQKMGECIMPREGVFTRVLHGGTISVGDTLTVWEE